jgi:CRP-like cAMP-binding protein
VLWARRLELVDAYYAVHVRAVEPTVVAFMGRDELDRFILRNPEVGLRMMALLAERLGSSNERMAEIAHKEAVSRLASQFLRLLESEGVVDREGRKLPAAYTHEELGTMIGAGCVAVSRAFKELREEGAVDTGRANVRVRDPEALQRIADREGR